MIKHKRVWVTILFLFLMGPGPALYAGLDGTMAVSEPERAPVDRFGSVSGLPILAGLPFGIGGVLISPFSTHAVGASDGSARPWTMADLVFTLALALLLVGAVVDVYQRKIPNWMTVPAAVLGLLTHTISGGWSGLGQSLLGLVLGLSFLFLFYWVGGMGAGDVKLMGAAGAIVGAPLVGYAFVWTGLLGGVVAVACILSRRAFGETGRNLFGILTVSVPRLARRIGGGGAVHAVGLKDARLTTPYGVAIAAGTLLCVWISKGGFLV